MLRQLKIIYFLLSLVNIIHALKCPPTFLHQPAQTASIQPSQPLSLNCQATGHPTPMYRWKKNGSTFNYRNNSRITQQPGVGTLTFLYPELTDVGVYQCSAENQFGKAISNLAVVSDANSVANISTAVVVTEALYWIKTPNDTADRKSTRISFECIAGGNPAPTVQWLKNGQPLRGNGRIRIKGNEMVIEPVLGDIDTAVYQCNATNEAEYILANFYLNALQFAPIISQLQKEMRVMSKVDAELNCIADGSPTPTIRWEKDNFPISNGSKFIVNEGYLNIRNISSKDQGQYKCFASNKLGQDFKSTTFIVLNSTKITLLSVNQSVPFGTAATFSCNAIADSNLNLKVEWKFNGRRLDPSVNSRVSLLVDSVLHIADTIDSDAGLYTCVASTEYDSVNASTYLTVQNVPNAPKITKVTCNGILASIEWTSKGDNGAPIVAYDIQLSNNFEPHTWSDVFTNLSVSDSPTQRRVVPLKPWTRYSFRVLARNAIGYSQPSISYGFCSTKSLPPFRHPENVTVRADEPGNLIISWNEINQTEHNADGFRYKVFWKSADDPDDQWNCQKIMDWQQTVTTLENLGIYVRYRIRVESKNSKGHPSQSAEEIIAWSGEAKPLYAPQNLQLLKILNATSALVSWDPMPVSAIQGHFRGYKVVTKVANETASYENVFQTEETRVTITGLKSNAVNLVTVLVMNSVYESDPSNEIQVHTPQLESVKIV